MRTLQQTAQFGWLAQHYSMLRQQNPAARASDVYGYLTDPGTAQNLDQYSCGHEWAVNDETDRCYCCLCGADGDA